MNCNTTHYRANSSSVPGDPTGLAAVVLALAGTSACSIPPFKRLEKKAGGDRAFVEATVSMPPGVVEAGLRRLFAGGRTPLGAPFGRFRLEARDSRVFPDDLDLRDNAGGNPALERYLQIPLPRRAADFYLVDVSDTFWPSEYHYRDEPVRFRSDFIVHLAADDAGNDRTRIEVLEYRPIVWLGERLGLGHAGPAMVRDVRVVSPTTRDRELVLDQLVQALTDSSAR